MNKRLLGFLVSPVVLIRLSSILVNSGCFINGRTYIGIPLDLDPRAPINTTRRFDEFCPI
jgi:hypothetical protein